MGAVFLVTNSVEGERHVGTLSLRDVGDYAIINLPNGTVRVWLDLDRVVADIQTQTGGHIISTWASFEELDQASEPSR